MEEISGWFGFLGPAFLLCGLAVIREHRKNMRLAAEGDEKTRAMLARWRTTEALLGPVLMVIGVCMTLVTYLADYQEAKSSLPAEQAIEKLLRAMPK
jgi:hypothetical protein